MKEQTKTQKSSDQVENIENDSPRSSKTLTPKEKVRLWLPTTGVESDSNIKEHEEIKDNEMTISNLTDEKNNEKRDDSDDDKMFNESFETVVAAQMT